MFKSYALMWNNYSNFSGRTRRRDFWLVQLCEFLFPLLLSVLLIAVPQLVYFIRIIAVLYNLATFIPHLALCFRRLHDIGKSGTYVLLGLISLVSSIILLAPDVGSIILLVPLVCIIISLADLVGSIILLVLYCKDSEPRENEYGDSPKYHVPVVYGPPTCPNCGNTVSEGIDLCPNCGRML